MKRLGVTAVVLVVFVTGAFTGFASAEQSANAGGANGGHNGDRPDDPGTFFLNQSVNYGERVAVSNGIYMDGTLFPVDAVYTNPAWPLEQHMMYAQDVDVTADWSDNLVLHKWRAGDKIRTEVILKDILDPTITIYTIRASFSIDMVDPVTGAVTDDVWAGTTFDGLWVDGVTDAYSAEVNQLGLLLYGYNWDTGSLSAGQYRLTFTLTAAPILAYPGTGDSIDYNTITIAGMEDPSLYGGDENYSLLKAGYTSSSTAIEIYLYEK